jgi:hypothetical protein
MKISAPGYLYFQVRNDIYVCWDRKSFFKKYFQIKDLNENHITLQHHITPYEIM